VTATTAKQRAHWRKSGALVFFGKCPRTGLRDIPIQISAPTEGRIVQRFAHRQHFAVKENST
jgi:hypothetical protein